jgi:hypothetical protein
MSFKLSRNKVNFLASLITEYIEKHEELDYSDNIGDIRLKIFHLIMDQLRFFEDTENSAKERIQTQKKNIPEGSREWEILFRKYSIEELNKAGRIWD